MNRIKEEEIPEAFLKWINDESDIWLFRFTRSIGYTFEEIIKLSKTNPKIEELIPFISESMLEKSFYRVAQGYFNNDLASAYLSAYMERIHSLTGKKKKFINLHLNHFDRYDEFDSEDDDFDDGNDHDGNADDSNSKNCKFIKMET